ncbi:MAG: translocation/assembly module TamB domain-containing protein [Coleofasciculaceae cyanobacterium]
MKNAPNPSNEPTPTPTSPKVGQKRRRHLALLVSFLVASGIAGASAWTWFFVYRQLAPSVQDTVSKILSRPVKMGKVESFSLTGLRFGATELPATATDSDRASVQNVDVSYNLIPLILNRRLELDVTLVKPKVYIEQDADGQWVTTKIKTLPKGAIDVKLQTLQLRDADVELLPRGAAKNVRKPIFATLSSGKSRFLNNNKLIQFETQGSLVKAGNFTLKGESRTDTGQINLAVSGNKIGAAELGRLIQLPLLLQAGQVDGNLEINITRDKPLTFSGTATLDKVTARLAQLPQPFSQTNGQLRFKGTQVQLEKVTTLFGQIPAVANGTIDTQADINLTAQTAAVDLPKILQAFKFPKLPIPVLAEVQTALQVTGPLAKPIVSGQVKTTKVAQVDRLNLQNASAQFRLVDSKITISNIVATPSVGGVVKGTGTVTLGDKGTAQFDAQASNVPADAIAKIYELDLPFPLGLISGTTQIATTLANPQNYRATGTADLNLAGGSVKARNIQVNAGNFSTEVQANGVKIGSLVTVPEQFNVPVSGNFNLAGSLSSLSLSTIQGSGNGRLNIAGGTVNASDIQLANGRFTAQIEASEVQPGQLASVPAQFNSPLSGNFNIAGDLASFSTDTIKGSGSGSLNLAGGKVNINDLQLADGRFTAQIRASGVEIGRLATVPPQFNSPLSGVFNVSGALASLSPQTIKGSGSGSLNLAGGTVNASNIQLAEGRFTAQVRANGVQLGKLAAVPPQLDSPVSGNFNVSGDLASLSPQTIKGSGSGSLNVAGGTVNASNIQLADGRFTAQVEANGVQIGQLAPIPSQFNGPVSGNFNLSGDLASLSPSTVQGSGSGRLNVGGGTVNLSEVQLNNGRFQAVVEPQGVQLAGFSPQLRGDVGGRLNVAGSLTALSPTAIQAEGRLNFSEGISIIDRSLTADISWNGQQLQIQQATAANFSANGVVNVNLNNPGLQAIDSFALNVKADDLNLQQLAQTLPNVTTVAGRADFNGTIAGTVAAPNVNGSVNLRDFAVAGLQFESPLAGNVATVPGQQLTLNLNGTNDQIFVALTPDYQPVAFNIKRGEAIASGTRQGDILQVNTANFPIALIKDFPNVPAAIATQPLSGNISGNVAVNLKTFDVALNNIELNGSIFAPPKGSTVANSRYILSGNIARTAAGPEFKNIQLEVKQGELSVILAALQSFQLLNVTTASRSFGVPLDSLVVPINLQNESLQTKLRRLSEIKALEQQEEAIAASSPLPDFTKVQGSFTGLIALDGSLASGVKAKVNIEGQNWQLDTYQVDKINIVGDGSFQNGVLTLLPLQIQSGDSLIAYTGTIGGDAQSGQLQLSKIPIEELQAILQKVPNLPSAFVGLTGLIDATATLSGSIKNPQARGSITIEPNTNQAELERIQGSFSYANARLNFGTTVNIAGVESSSIISGSIPYQLPFASVAATDNSLNLNINVKNEGLTLLNILSNGQVSWVNGGGNVQLAINGFYNQTANNLAQLEAKGTVDLDNATLQANALPEPITNVSGRVLFNFDRAQIDPNNTLRGQLSGGDVTVVGSLPFVPSATVESPLTVNIGELPINLKGLYAGRVQGNVVITGTALSPKIGGQVNLFDGQVSLAEGATTTTVSAGNTAGGDDSTSPSGIEFNALKLTLGKDVQITRAPIVNFLADGTLTINGTLDNLRPEGTITLERGQVNLFTTQFRLARGYENTAKFFPNQGLDPTLDVRLRASVTESTQRRLPTDPFSAEIADNPVTNLGSVRTVDIQARVDGPVSQLATNLELTSTPGRSESEIVALLGGSFVDTLGRGDSTLGLANLAGSALLGNVQNIIGDALGLSEFRLYPTVITDEQRRTSNLGLAAEVGVDISRNFSVSAQKILTTDDPFEYSLRYRLNEQLLLRGATNLSGDSRAAVEYERRF